MKLPTEQVKRTGTMWIASYFWRRYSIIQKGLNSKNCYVHSGTQENWEWAKRNLPQWETSKGTQRICLQYRGCSVAKLGLLYFSNKYLNILAKLLKQSFEFYGFTIIFPRSKRSINRICFEIVFKDWRKWVTFLITSSL